MENVLIFIFGIYVWGYFISWAIFWWKKTDRSQAPIQRRTKAAGYALIWPYFLFEYFTGKQDRERGEADRQKRKQDILGTSGASGSPDVWKLPASPPSPSRPTQGTPSAGTSKIRNPFDDR